MCPSFRRAGLPGKRLKPWPSSRVDAKPRRVPRPQFGRPEPAPWPLRSQASREVRLSLQCLGRALRGDQFRMRFNRRSLTYIDYFAQVLELVDGFGISKTGRSHSLDGEDLVFAWRDSGEMEFSIVARRGAVIV